MVAGSALPERSIYRKDIDGMRGIAVLAVIVNHFTSRVLPCGFVGVDIFFAISGFVITASLVGRSESTLGEFILAFYSRRIRRLWPGLLLCVLVTGFVISLFELSPVASLRTGIAALFAVANLFLLKQATNYFGSAASLNAFTHTWSLGVEEQFYLVYPLLYWFGLHRVGGRRRMLVELLMVGTLIISLAAYLYYIHVNQPMAFFLMPTRWWEMIAGCLTFLAVRRFAEVRWALLPLVLVVLLGILILPVRYGETATIVSVVCTCVLLFAVHDGSSIYGILTWKPLVYIGLLSYSLYLWHWVMLIVFRWTVGVRLALLPVELGVVFLFAALAYHFVERPLRRRLWFNSRGATVATGVLGSVVAASILLVLLYPAAGKLYTGTVSMGGDEKNPMPSSGTDGSVVLIGDSHARQFVGLGQDLAKRHGKGFTLISINSTPFPSSIVSTPAGGLTLEKTRNNAQEMNTEVNNYFQTANPEPGDLILLSSFYMIYFSTPLGARRFQSMSHYDADGRRISQEEALQSWLNRLESFAEAHPSEKIVVILSTPEMPEIYPGEMCQREWFRPTVSDRCFVQEDRAATIERLGRVNALITARARRHENMLVFDPLDSVCPATGTVCSSAIGGRRIYEDEDHLNEAGARLVELSLEEFLVEHRVLSPGTLAEQDSGSAGAPGKLR
jgi:peptidoglycan/LPS O-acetylase OafA/YrhL